jgi:ferredoxin
MAHVITSLCLRDSACVDVCPVECIVGGKPEAQWPWFYIDPATCIDCGACVPECPFEAIFPEDEVPTAYTMKPAQKFVVHGDDGAQTYTAEGGEVYDFTGDTAWNAAFYAEGTGPGYAAKNM